MVITRVQGGLDGFAPKPTNLLPKIMNLNAIQHQWVL